jgi:Trk K+ transport system NAD-binding subunit
VEVSLSLAILAFEELRPAGRVAGVVRDEMYARALRLAGVNKVINPVLDAADMLPRRSPKH